MRTITATELEGVGIADLEFSTEEVGVHSMSPERKIAYRLVAIRGTPLSVPVQIPYVLSEGPQGVYWTVFDNSKRDWSNQPDNGPESISAVSEDNAKQIVLDRLRSAMKSISGEG